MTTQVKRYRRAQRRLLDAIEDTAQCASHGDPDDARKYASAAESFARALASLGQSYVIGEASE